MRLRPDCLNGIFRSCKNRRLRRSSLFSLAILVLSGCSFGGEQFVCQALGGYAVSGTVRYEKVIVDKEGSPISFFAPARNILVEVANVGTTTTDSEGRYCLIYLGSASLQVRSVYPHAVVPAPWNIQVGVLNTFLPFLPHSYVPGTYDENDGSVFQVNLTIREPQSGAFNILDTLLWGAQYFEAVTGEYPPEVVGVWNSPGSSGTYFSFNPPIPCADTGCIFVEGPSNIFFGEIFGTDNPDEFDDDIILHEYGHFLAHNFSEDDSPGGIHFLNDHSQDVRLAWSEGWATFYSSAVRANPVNTDTALDGIRFSFSIDSTEMVYPYLPGVLKSDAIYTTSEVAVATALWDVFDGVNDEFFDLLSLGFGPIWDILEFWRDTAEPSPITMEAFWDSFGETEPDFIEIVNERQMEFTLDSFETDNSPDPARKATLDETEHHTLFPGEDIDYIAFDVDEGSHYTVETLNLSNGADTFLEILDQDGLTILASNDNADGSTYGNGCNTWGFINGLFAPRNPPACPNGPIVFTVSDSENSDNPFPSKVTFPAPATGTFYARVSRSPQSPPSTGRYGSYDFRISSGP